MKNLGYKTEKNKTKSIEVKVNDYEYSPKDDITVIELSKIFIFMFASNIGANNDFEFYMNENNLNRHFTKSKGM